MNIDASYRLADGIAIRRERFGGLVYNHHNRQLFFLHSPILTEFVRGLAVDQPLAETLQSFCVHHHLAPEAAEALRRSFARLERLGLVTPLPRSEAVVSAPEFDAPPAALTTDP